MASSSSKKRKRGADDADKVTLQVSNQPPAQLGPVLASFPALQPPKSTSFQCWRRRNASDNEPFASQETLIAGEADTVDFYSASEFGQASSGCSYLIGVHDKRTNTTTLRPAPLHILAREVKALKNLAPMEVTTEERMLERNNLGEAFGTKKAKAAIRARERNRVDVDAMRGVTSHLQETILANTGSLPTQEEAKASADSSRLIPSHNVDAQRPQDVYPLHGIIPEAEFNALSIAAFKAAEPSQRQQLLPYSRSNWVNQHLRLLSSAPKLKKSEMKILLYISTMFAFKMASRLVSKKDELQARLGDVPGIVVDGLLSRFSETARSANAAQVTPQSETMLLTHMFALCLRIDDYATDTTLIAHDLSMPVEKVNTLFKSLGCKIEKLDHKQLKQLGLPDAAGDTKRAVLKVPVEFPKVRQRRTRR
ncbi:RNA polymerase I associated factor, A49-like protein [Amylocystis lapponica]|nr:RNA polymerase I associated factor, A49-like protein [Amylocystis lapponica]